MARGSAALAGGDNATAKKLFASVTEIAPNFAEGWHARAQIQQQDGDDEAAMLSLQKVVTLNPRQFEAMSELGDMLEDYGNQARRAENVQARARPRSATRRAPRSTCACWNAMSRGQWI